MHKVAVVGDRGSVLAFQALGVDVFTPSEPSEVRKVLDKLARTDYAVIFLTEALAEQVPETLEHYQSQPMPAIILIPDSQGSRGMGLAQISKNVEKAIGMDIF